MNKPWLFIVLLIISYLIGCFNNAIFLSKLKKKDVRTMGSGNPGTLNMSRNFGLGFGLLTLFLDAVKGAIPTLLGFLLLAKVEFPKSLSNFDMQDLGMYACGFFAVLGHIYPVFYKFKGGKGVATTIGVMLTSSICTLNMAWITVTLMSFVAAILFIYFTEYGAMGSFIAITPPACAASIRLFVKYGVALEFVGFYVITNAFILGICFITWFAHRKNIERMLAGEEHPTSIKEMLVKLKTKKAKEKE